MWQAWCRKPKSHLCAYCILNRCHVLMISPTTTDLTKMFKIALNISANCEVQLIQEKITKNDHFHTWKKPAILPHKLSSLLVFLGHQNIFAFFVNRVCTYQLLIWFFLFNMLWKGICHPVQPSMSCKINRHLQLKQGVNSNISLISMQPGIYHTLWFDCAWFLVAL